jgi:hypothetical protein
MYNNDPASTLRLSFLGKTLYVILLAGFAASNNAAAEKTEAAGPSQNAQIRFVSAKPTVFLIKQKNTLLQVAELTIENTSAPVEVWLELTVGSKKKTTSFGKVEKGKATFQVHIPQVTEPTPAVFILKANGKTQFRQELVWQPWDAGPQRWRLPATHTTSVSALTSCLSWPCACIPNAGTL